MAAGAGGPTIRKWRVSVLEVPTDVVRISYSNKLFMLISQTGKMGTVFHIDNPASVISREELSVEAKTLIGHRNDVALDVYARRIYETVCASAPVPMVLSLAFSDYTPANLTALIAELKKTMGLPAKSLPAPA
jgi:hypothetical protein